MQEQLLKQTPASINTELVSNGSGPLSFIGSPPPISIEDQYSYPTYDNNQSPLHTQMSPALSIGSQVSQTPTVPMNTVTTSMLNMPNHEAALSTTNNSVTDEYIVPLALPEGTDSDNILFCATNTNRVGGSGSEQSETCKQVSLGPDKQTISPVHVDMSSTSPKFVTSSVKHALCSH